MKQIIELADGAFAEIDQSGYTELSTKTWSGDVLGDVGKHIKLLSEKFSAIADQVNANDCLDSVQVESSIRLGAKGSFFFVQGSSEAHFLVRLNFKAQK